MPRPGFFPNAPKGCGYYSLHDHLTGQSREAAPQSGYPASAAMPFSFFNADFRYLDDPKTTGLDYSDALKRIRLGDDWMFSTGGQVWSRYMNLDNARLTQADDVHTLFRARAYGDLWYRDQFRLFGEFITAQSFWYDLNPQAIDRDRADFLNLFVDVKVAESCGKAWYLRVGRQELLLGSQRLVSPLDWANTRRTFQGVSLWHQGETWDTTLFWVQPILQNPGEVNSVDNNQNFAGAWFTYKPEKGRLVDLYYLFLDNTNNLTQQGIERAPFHVHTLGSRYMGDKDHFLWDLEAAVQLGERGEQSILAGMLTAGAGYHFENAPLNPTFWLYYDFASGDGSPNAGDRYSTFNQLFPFGHYYMGWIDLVARQNIHDVNAHLYLYPTPWMMVWFQYHHFRLAESRDALYNAAGAAYRRDPTGAAGTDVGNEIDLVINFHLTKHSDLMLGYSKLWGGGFLDATSGPNAAKDADQLFAIYSYRW
jgi:hypothetical protein